MFEGKKIKSNIYRDISIGKMYAVGPPCITTSGPSLTAAVTGPGEKIVIIIIVIVCKQRR